MGRQKYRVLAISGSPRDESSTDIIIKAVLSGAEDAGHEYFVKLVGDMEEARNDLGIIKTALEKINDFSE